MIFIDQAIVDVSKRCDTPAHKYIDGSGAVIVGRGLELVTKSTSCDRMALQQQMDPASPRTGGIGDISDLVSTEKNCVYK